MRRSLRVKDIELNYEVIGEGRNILFLHGFGLHLESQKYSNEPIFKGESFRRVYLDLPGMGKSGYSDEIKNSEDILTCIMEFIEHVFGEDEFSIIGESYGGYLARGVLSKLPKQVVGLALVCPVIIPDYSNRTLPEHKVCYEDKEYLNTLDEEDIEDLGFLVIKSKRTIDRTIKEIFDPMADTEDFLIRIKENGYGFDYDVDKEIGLFEGNTLFLLGKYDSVTGFEDAKEIKKHYPKSTYIILDEAGHNLHIEQEDLYNEYISKWLKAYKQK